MKRLGMLAVLLWASAAHAQDLADRFNARVSLSGMYLTETQSTPDTLSYNQSVAGPLHIGYGELRLSLDGRRLGENWDLHVDGRIRLTSGYDTDALAQNDSETGARGYLGGREYQLYELWARGHWGKIDLSLGRMLVAEADAMRIDGVRLWIKASRRWRVSVYAGGYSDPYSRSLTTDYVSAPAFAGGVSARYDYDKIQGSFSGNAAYLGGKDDGGPFIPTSANPTVANPQTEGTRAFITWNNFWRPARWIDFYHDLVVDVWGAAHTQLTRLDLAVAGHINKHLTIRASYDHMSSIAIEMYLTRLLNDRAQFQMGSLENNLTLSRTARDEGRLAIEGLFGRTMLTLDGRIRRRVLVTPSNDAQFLTSPATDSGDQVAPKLGYDATVALRNSGSLAGLRPSIWATYLSDYRARDFYAGVGLGRDLLLDRLSIDIGLTYANVHDDMVGTNCTQVTPTVGSTALNIGINPLTGCFGNIKSNNVQPGITISTTPTRHWNAFIDYRAGIQLVDGVNAVVTHVVVGRVEARY